MNSHKDRVDHGAPVRLLSNFRTESHEPSAGNLKYQSRLVHAAGMHGGVYGGDVEGGREKGGATIAQSAIDHSPSACKAVEREQTRPPLMKRLHWKTLERNVQLSFGKRNIGGSNQSETLSLLRYHSSTLMPAKRTRTSSPSLTIILHLEIVQARGEKIVPTLWTTYPANNQGKWSAAI